MTAPRRPETRPPSRPRRSRIRVLLSRLGIALLGCAIALIACARVHSPVRPASAHCSLSPTSLDFGSVTGGSHADQTFTLTNTGSDRIAGSVGASCDGFSIAGGTAYDLAPTEAASFTVRFAPSHSGSFACDVSI